MELWQLIALLAAGALGVGVLAKSSTAQAIAALPSTPSPLSQADMDLLNQVFQAAVSQENNVDILAAFEVKLRAAGFDSYANAIDKRRQHAQMFLAPMQSTVLTTLMGGKN